MNIFEDKETKKNWVVVQLDINGTLFDPLTLKSYKKPGVQPYWRFKFHDGTEICCTGNVSLLQREATKEDLENQ